MPKARLRMLDAPSQFTYLATFLGFAGRGGDCGRDRKHQGFPAGIGEDDGKRPCHHRTGQGVPISPLACVGSQIRQIW